MKQIRGVKVMAMEPANWRLYLNITVKPLDDIRVRQAIAYAIDRKAMVQFNGAGRRARGVSVVPARLSRAPRSAAASPTTSPRPRRCSPRPAIRTA